MERFGDGDNVFWAIRNYDNGAHYAVIGLSQGGSRISVDNVQGGTYRDAVTGREVTVAAGGTLEFDVQAGSAGIYILDGPGKVGEDGVFLR